MDKVITINNWWDGPLSGLAYYNGTVCIYERIFDEIIDDYIDEYILTPINKEEEVIIMNEWKEWCDAVHSKQLEPFYNKYFNKDTIKLILENSTQKSKYRKKAKFSGTKGDGYIPVDYNVEWYE